MPRSNRGDDPTPKRQLRRPCVRNPRRGRCCEDTIVGSTLRVSQAAVSDDDRDVGEAGRREVRPCSGDEGRVPLDRDHVPRPDEGREEGRVVPGTRPDFEDPLSEPELGFLQHDRDHRGGRDRLTVPDRQGCVFVRRLPRFLRHEHIAGHRKERVPDPRAPEVSFPDEAIHHVAPRRDEIDFAPHGPPTGPARNKSCSHPGTRTLIKTVDRTRVAAVTGKPAFTKSFIDTVTPSREAIWTTSTLRAAPRIVAFPAGVELAARASQSWVEACETTSERRRTEDEHETAPEHRDGGPFKRETADRAERDENLCREKNGHSRAQRVGRGHGPRGKPGALIERCSTEMVRRFSHYT